MPSGSWVCRTADVKALIESQIPQLMVDLAGSDFEQIDEDGNKVGWRAMLSERMTTIDGRRLAESYVRRIYNIMQENYAVTDAHLADVICIALGMNSSVYLKTYPASATALFESLKAEAECDGIEYDRKALRNQAFTTFPEIEKEIYPEGKTETPYQKRCREYESKKRRRKAA